MTITKKEVALSLHGSAASRQEALIIQDAVERTTNEIHSLVSNILQRIAA